MPIDYSKWDKIEISDDSDVEVHPNVDKSSFIKWKQRDIHEKRQQRNIEIKSILVQLTMYVKLNERVDYILKNATDDQLLDNAFIVKAINSKFDPKEKFSYEKLKEEKGSELRKGLRDLTFDAEEIENTPCYNEMIEDLFIQIKEDHEDARNDGARIREYVKEHRTKIDDVLLKLTIKLDDLLYQKSMLVTSEDLHTGFDKTFMNKSTDEPETKAEQSTVAKVEPPATESSGKTKIVKDTPSPSSKSEVSSSKPSASPSASVPAASVPSSSAVAAPPANSTPSSELDDLTIHPDTLAYSKITSVQASAEFLIRHTYICTEEQKDALLMSAFDAQLSGDSALALRVIHQSLILQYVAQLAGPKPPRDQTIKAIKLFCGKIADKSSPASNGFLQDVQNTFNHIVQRCEVIKAEHASGGADGDEGEAQIQLKALDDDTQLLVNLPEPNTPQYEIFTTQIPVEMQTAVKTGSLDEVNKVFASMKVEEAEHILELFDQCGVIGINAYLEDENEFKQLQDQYNENLHLKEENTEKFTQEYNTVDEVD